MHIKYPSINQFRHVVQHVTHRATYLGKNEAGEPQFDTNRPKPVLTFTGTTKLHGSNASVVLNLRTGQVHVQSRERILTIEEDNHEFCAWAQSERPSKLFEELFLSIQSAYDTTDYDYLAVFGEWVGPTVNAKTAIGQLSNRFVAIGATLVKLNGADQDEDDEEGITKIERNWLDLYRVQNLFFGRVGTVPDELRFITEFEQWHMNIDFNYPEVSLAPLERLTLQVEECCPVAKALGKEGMGEGIVWICVHPQYGRLVFKTKGEKHKGTKNKRLVSVAPEAMASRDAFVDAVLTESRLEQGLDLLKARYGTVTPDHLGEFLKWIGTDILKEETDTLKSSGLEKKDVMGLVNRRAKDWLKSRFELTAQLG